MTEDSDSPEINEGTKHLTLQSADETEDLDGSRFWAVLIGVDGDPHYPLHGCLSNTELMEKYLIEDLGVSVITSSVFWVPQGRRPPRFY
ncbi:hypothetical protein ARMSODRAFT_1017560 [Armillaria solidipes]|uniref:Uncharacterized protein n=1 Tax=Armillaria solidipes TaxID=1076256 RepID=A0A2H3C1R2_9AGAR|nr:hypothetical protein ARMSODRAFT_1017560 [Armillaria solidipes]